ncbi:hypothetical protein ACHWQZ_G000538 [Mnemiopsis leidyi]
MVLFSRLLKCKQHSQNAQIITTFIRQFSRKYRPRGHTSKQKLTPSETTSIEAAPSFSWKPIIKQICFTLPFLVVLRTVNSLWEVIETKYHHMIKSTQFKFDVYDDVWGEIIDKFCNCSDTLFNRRIIQLIAFSSVCFVASLFIRKSERLIRKLGASASSSFISPLTSIFMHGSLPHLALNMLSLFVLTIGWEGRGPIAHGSLDQMSHQHLLYFLIMSGTITSIVCNFRYLLLKSPDISVGFSGALCALLMFEFTQKPDSKVQFIFTGPDTYFTAGDAGKFIICFELVLLALKKYHRIDSLGHLVGFLFGFFYVKYYDGVGKWNEELREMNKTCAKELSQK